MTWTPDKVEALAKELGDYAKDWHLRASTNRPIVSAASALTWALERIDTLSRLDREAATHVETIICMRTHFTGDSPYVGWKGLGLALREHLDRIEAERDAANARADEVLGLLQATAPLGEASFKLPLDWITKRDATIRALKTQEASHG
jgi:hypothetical protein